MTTGFEDLPVVIVPDEEDLVPSSSSLEEEMMFQEKPQTTNLATPSKNPTSPVTSTDDEDDDNGCRVVTPDSADGKGSLGSQSSGDTCSETSVASSNLASDILFGKPTKDQAKKGIVESFEEEDEEDDDDEEDDEDDNNPVLDEEKVAAQEEEQEVGELTLDAVATEGSQEESVDSRVSEEEEEVKEAAQTPVEDEKGNEPVPKESKPVENDTTATTTGQTIPAEPPGNKLENSSSTEEEPQKLHCVTSSTPNIIMDDLPSPPLRTNRVSLTAAAFDRPSPITTPRRTSAVGTGLSELSKQLRVLQAKNKHLQSEMERCQRQLKIMSESKGVSVIDVLASLESACATEAHAELQSQIASLQAQLEALKLGKSPPRGSGGVAKATQLAHESLKQQIASLQLQVGEHEEMEAKFKEETKALYAQVQTHQTKATTLEATCAQQASLLGLESARTTALEAEVKALREERDMLKEKQTKRMAEFWQHTLHKSWSIDENDYMMDNAMGLYHNDSKNSKEAVAQALVDGASDKPSDFNASRLPNSPPDNTSADNESFADVSTIKSSEFKPLSSKGGRPSLCRTYSDPALWSQDPDMKANMPKAFVSSMIPQYSKKYKQWNYDVADDTHRSKRYVKQSAKNMELEVLCRHQQQTIQELQNDQSRDTAKWEKLEQARNAAEARRSLIEQQVNKLELDLRLESDQAESLRAQLHRREEEFSLKKDQLNSRLQVHQERIVDVEGQLSSLYVAYELLQEDREEEQQEQAQLKSRLIDADTMLAKEISEKTKTGGDANVAHDISQQEFRELQDQDVSESSAASYRSTGEAANLRKSAGLLMPSPSPKRTSRRSLFSKGNSASVLGLPKSPPFASGSRRASTGGPGLPPTGPTSKRRSSTGSSAVGDPPPPPGTTLVKGYLLHQQPRKKKLLRGEKPPAWKRKYVVLKRGDGPAGAGSYCFWYGDVPQGKVRGTVPHIIRGISTVSFGGSITSDPENKPHSFFLRINPSDPDAPVAHFAAFSSVELEPWKNVLKIALDVDFHKLSLEEQQRSQALMSNAASKNYQM
ncbi:expressed unknown protein [Seminavis robusta]|uniref:PH domain-containing protein n=1 Tax=Seminavis robusta TaxID=568900 RepID=A0A9N8D7C3_9STRA|nr:expressed unknown protein [Seminavis robusta]|eukprot:Sro20_g013880.1 n/a (1052) ;mRNA; r:26061-29216